MRCPHRSINARYGGYCTYKVGSVLTYEMQPSGVNSVLFAFEKPSTKLMAQKSEAREGWQMYS